MQKLKNSYFTGEGNGQLLYETIGRCFERVAKANPEGMAVIVKHQSIRWSYRQLYKQVDRLSLGLLALGVQPGDRVGIWGPNSIEWVMSQLATARIGAIMVCINPAYRLYELEYALNRSSCKVIISAEKFKNSNYLTMLEELAPELKYSQAGTLKSAKLPHLELVIRMGTQVSAGMLNFDDVCGLGSKNERQRLEALQLELNPDDAINIQFTSGTTGQPKGATLSHCNILNNGWNSAQGMQLTERDKLCIPVPLYHCFGMVLGVLACLTSGATMVFPCQEFDAEITLATVEEEKCTGLHGVPTMFVALLNLSRFNNYNISTLRTGIVAGAPCAEALMKRVIGDLNMSSVLIGYGQTEVSPINLMTLPDDTLENRTQTVGRAIPHVEVKIVDEHNRVLSIGEQGEVCTRGYSVMKGYWDDEQRTNEAIIDGWLHSGDLATMDQFGYVKITGRIKDMLIRGGENIYPREIEDFLYTHPKIREAQVFGVPDEKMGEEVCVWIQLKDGQSATDQEIRNYCEGQITHFKIPRYIRFVKEFPMTVTGKIRKIEMRATMSAEV